MFSRFVLSASALLFAAPLFAQNGAPAANNNLLTPLIYIAIALVFFYFILWRPEQKRRRALEDLRSSIKKGDRIIVAGIFGEVHQIKEKTVIIKLHDGATMEVLKGAIIEVCDKNA